MDKHCTVWQFISYDVYHSTRYKKQYLVFISVNKDLASMSASLDLT